MDWDQRGTRAGLLDLDFIQTVKRLNYHPGFLVYLLLLFWCLNLLEKHYFKKGICFNALNLVLGNHVREQPSWPLGKNKYFKRICFKTNQGFQLWVHFQLCHAGVLFAYTGQAAMWVPGSLAAYAQSLYGDTPPSCSTLAADNAHIHEGHTPLACIHASLLWGKDGLGQVSTWPLLLQLMWLPTWCSLPHHSQGRGLQW